MYQHVVKITVQIILILAGLNLLASAVSNRDILNEVSPQTAYWMKIVIGIAALFEVYYLYEWVATKKLDKFGDISYNPLPPASM